MIEMSILALFIAGACGAFTKEILEDNKIKLPKICDGELELGFIGSIFTGAAAGYFVDHSPITAFFAGYSGYSIIKSLAVANGVSNGNTQNMVEQLIRAIAKSENVDEELAVKVAKCESNLSPTATNTNKDGTKDRGLFQINDKWHPEVSDSQAFDIIFSTRFFCKAYKEGNIGWWNASKSCWNK